MKNTKLQFSADKNLTPVLFSPLQGLSGADGSADIKGLMVRLSAAEQPQKFMMSVGWFELQGSEK